MLSARLLFVFGLAALTAGCDRKPPSAPTSPPPPTVTNLAITGADTVLTGLPVPYTATATVSDGSTRTIMPAWTSSNSGVASVDGNGRLDGVGHGSTTLTAAYEGRSVSKTVHVVNNYGGRWEGRYVIRTCTDTGDLPDHDGGWCLAGPGRPGSVHVVHLTLVQGGDNLSDITGTYPFLGGTTRGTVSANGRLTLSGLLTEPDFDYPEIIIATLQVGPWDTSLAGTNSMTGRWSWVYTPLVGRKGTAHTDNEFVTMTRVSPSVLPTSANR